MTLQPVAVLVALAAFNLGPRAAAAYQPVAGTDVPDRVGLDAGTAPDTVPKAPTAGLPADR